MKKCPFCAEEIQDDAIKCRYCGEWLEEIESIAPEVTEIEPSKKLKTETADTEFFYRSPQNDAHFDPTLPRPWNRFWARSIDYTLFLFMYYLVVVVISMAEISLTFSDNILINAILNGILGLIVSVTFLVCFESIWISKLSTTPGKALFGIRILIKSGEKLSYTDAVKRSFSVLAYGYAFLIAFPVVQIFTMWSSLKYIKKNGVAIWDNKNDFRVIQSKLDPLRYWSGVLVGVAMFIILSSFLMINYGLNKTMFKEQSRKQYKTDWDATRKKGEAINKLLNMLLLW